MITDEEIQKVVSELLAKYGENIPDIEHEPITLKYLVNLYLYDIRKEQLQQQQ